MHDLGIQARDLEHHCNKPPTQEDDQLSPRICDTMRVKIGAKLQFLDCRAVYQRKTEQLCSGTFSFSSLGSRLTAI
jgi:hypothetical protein